MSGAGTGKPGLALCSQETRVSLMTEVAAVSGAALMTVLPPGPPALVGHV